MAPRHLFTRGGKLYCYVSNHPLEERTIELTADYRLADGTLLLPELLAWDGIETVMDDDGHWTRRQHDA